jgi:hypothetical protein
LALIVHQGRIHDRYRENADPLWLHGLDAVHVALGTLTTAGSKSSPTPVCAGELTVRNCPLDSRYSDRPWPESLRACSPPSHGSLT